MKEMVGFARQPARSAHHLYPAKLAEPRGNSGFPRHGRMVNVKLHIARHEQIESSIVVVVAPGGACGPTAQRHAGLFRDVCECAVAIVVIETILSEIRDVDVGPTVVVEVTERIVS